VCKAVINLLIYIRIYWKPPETVKIHPTKQGQILSFDMYNKMEVLFNDINVHVCIPNFN
jgi:hypothetical protein